MTLPLSNSHSTVHVHLNLPYFTSSPPATCCRTAGVVRGVTVITPEITCGCNFTKQQHNIQENIKHHSSTLSISSSDLHHLFCLLPVHPSLPFSSVSFIRLSLTNHLTFVFLFFSRFRSALCVTCLSLRLGSILHLWLILSSAPLFHIHHPSAVSPSWF